MGLKSVFREINDCLFIILKIYNRFFLLLDVLSNAGVHLRIPHLFLYIFQPYFGSLYTIEILYKFRISKELYKNILHHKELLLLT